MTAEEQLRMYQDYRSGMTEGQLGLKYGLSTMQVVKNLANAKSKLPKEFQVINLGTPLHLRGDFIIVADVHVPATDWGFAQNVARLADKTGIRRLIIAGDMFNMDAFSTYAPTVTPVTWAQERDAARLLLMDWLETFEEIYTIAGNHERRLTKWAAGNLDESDIYGMVVNNPKLVHSEYGYLTVESGGIPWRITHPKNYGKQQLTVLSDLANKFQTNVIGAHEHHNAIGWDVYKRYVICNIGMLADEKKFAYAAMDDNRMAGMTKGFVILRGGVATPLGLYPFTDWSMWLG